MRMTLLFLGILLLMVETTVAGSCKAVGEHEEGYNPDYCLAFRPSDAKTTPDSECCVISANFKEPIDSPVHLKDYLSFMGKSNVEKGEEVTFFNYKKFVDSDAESILYPLALPLKDNNEDTEEYFEFDLAFDANEFQCLKTLTEEQLSNGFPLLTISYTRRDEQQQTSDQSQCDKCLNTIYVRANAIKNILEKIKELNIPTYGAHWMIRAYVFTEQNQPTMLSFSCNWCKIDPIYDGFNGSMCPFKQTSWDKDSWSEPAKNFFKSSQINLASEVPYTYVPLVIHKPNKVHFWNNDLLKNEKTTSEFPCKSFKIGFSPKYRLLLRKPNEVG